MSEEEKQTKSNSEKIIISLTDELEWNADYEKEVKINRDMLDVLKESLNLIYKQQKETDLMIGYLSTMPKFSNMHPEEVKKYFEELLGEEDVSITN